MQGQIVSEDVSSLLPVQPHLLVGTPFCSHPQKLPPYFSLDLDAVDRALEYQTSLLRACEIVPDAVPDACRVQRWGEALARRGIREVVLDSRRQPGTDASPIVTLCRSLFKLDLRACCLFPETFHTGFPSRLPVGCLSLTDLRLVEVKIGDDELLGMASACKMLARLELIGCKGLKYLRLKEMNNLKDLIVHCGADAVVDEQGFLMIDAPNLEALDLRILAPRFGLYLEAPKVRSVHLVLSRTRRRFFPATARGLRRLLYSAPDICSLHLWGGVVDCLSVDRLPEISSSPYLHLKEVNINLALKHDRQALCLAVLLQQFPQLQNLHLVITNWTVPNLREAPPPPEFTEHREMLEQASCIRLNLQFVSISGCMGDQYEVEFAAFILTNALILNKLTLRLNKNCSAAGEYETRKLSYVSPASPWAKLVFRKPE